VAIFAGESPELGEAAAKLEARLLAKKIPAVLLGLPESAEEAGAASQRQQSGRAELLRKLGEAAFHLSGAGVAALLRLEELDESDAVSLASWIAPLPALWVIPEGEVDPGTDGARIRPSPQTGADGIADLAEAAWDGLARAL